MKLSVGYGMKPQKFEIPDNQIMGILKTNEFEIGLIGVEEVKRSLDNPIGSEKVEKLIKPGEKVVIITSDITRPVPSYKIIPSILDKLYEAGINKEDIVVVLALGSHRGHTDEEKIKLVGERVFNEVKCIDSDANDCVRMGVTSAGTPVDIFRVVAEADRRICVGNIEYHYFAGYSGGAKAIMP